MNRDGNTTSTTQTEADRIERDLSIALQRRELSIAYQPLICLLTAEVEGFEALARWNHPVLGLVSPALFIPVAEQSGLIDDLGEFVLREACNELRRLGEEFPDHPTGRPMTMSVNVSKRQLSGERLPNAVRQVLTDTAVPAERLCLEVTESVVVEQAEAVAPMLADIQKLGVRIAMDDFGVGQSSLSCLRQFPLDYLKIDRGFINDLNVTRRQAAVLQAVVTLAHDLELQVIGEGIETAEQVALLQTLNCDLGQGFYFSRPLSRDGVRLFLKQRLGAVRAEFSDFASPGDSGTIEAA